MTNIDKYGPDYMFDMVIEKADLRNDDQLARALKVSPALVSLVRSGDRRITPNLLLRIHEVFGHSVSKLREWAGMESAEKQPATQGEKHGIEG